MDLVDRYVQAVGAYLPRAQRGDIIAELAEDLRSQIDDRETSLGRPLTDAEREAILAQRGPPLRVATQFMPARSLIGPALLPIYVLVLKIVLAVQIGAFLLILVPMRVVQGASVFDALLQSVANLGFAVWIPIGVVTVIFALVERSQIDTPWSPRRVPRGQDTHVIPRSGAIAQGVLTAVFGLWWLSGAPFQVTLTAPLWHTLTHDAYFPVLLLALGTLALAGANVLRPTWTPLRLGVRAVLDGLSAAVAFAVLHTDWAQISADLVAVAQADTTGVARLNAWIELNVALVLGLIGIVGIVTCGVSAIRGIRLFAHQP